MLCEADAHDLLHPVQAGYASYSGDGLCHNSSSLSMPDKCGIAFSPESKQLCATVFFSVQTICKGRI